MTIYSPPFPDAPYHETVFTPLTINGQTVDLTQQYTYDNTADPPGPTVTLGASNVGVFHLAHGITGFAQLGNTTRRSFTTARAAQNATLGTFPNSLPLYIGLSSVPEPSPALLPCIGAGVIGILAWRRRKQAHAN